MQRYRLKNLAETFIQKSQTTFKAIFVNGLHTRSENLEHLKESHLRVF